MQQVLLHPLPLDGSMWPEEIVALCPGSLATDLYGLGDSIESWASGVLELARPGPLLLVGNSVGGSCAIEMTRLAPDRVRLVVLIGAKAGHRPEPALRDAAVRILEEGGMERAWETYWEPLFGRNVDPRVVARARDIACSQNPDDVIRGVRAFHSRPDRSAFLADVDVPVLVISGEDDLRSSNAVRRAGLRSGAFDVVPGAGHYVPMEKPGPLKAILQRAMADLVDTQ